jgi:hypothetical protein
MATYKGLTIHGTPTGAGGVGLDADFTKLADFVCGISGEADVDEAFAQLVLTPRQIFVIPSAGFGTSSTDGLALSTSGVAAAGAQQISPRLRWRGSGWKTDATAAAQAVNFIAEVLPDQGAAAPTGNLLFRYSVGVGAYATVLTLSSTGLLTSASDIVSGAGVTVRGTSTGVTGSGGELFYNAGASTTTLLSYNRTGSAYLALAFDALSTQFSRSGTVKIDIQAAGGVDIKDGVRFSGGSGTFATGVGLELFYNAGANANQFLSYDRGGSAYKALVFDASAHTLVVSGTDTFKLIANNTIQIVNSKTPASAGASGTGGEICWDTSYIYVCTATNTWKRSPLETTWPDVFALTDGANIATNAALASTFTVTLGGDRTMDNPTNPVDGKVITYRIRQDGTGTRLITWGSAFRFNAGVTPTLTTTAAKTDYISFKYHGGDSKWDRVWQSLNL